MPALDGVLTQQRNSVPRALAAFCLLTMLALAESVHGQFAQTLNIPPDPLPDLIVSSDTPPSFEPFLSFGYDVLLNFYDGAVLPDRTFVSTVGRVPGLPFIPPSEVNVHGGQFGDSFGVGSEVTMNVFGGTFGDDFDAQFRSVVNIHGGTFGDGLDAESGSLINVTGGVFGDRFDANRDSTVNVSGGRFDGRFFDRGAEVRVSGGVFRTFDARATLVGGEFVRGTDFLSGVFANGSPFVFYGRDGDANFECCGDVSLVEVELPPVGKTSLIATQDTLPTGIRAGQTLVVDANGVVQPGFTAYNGSHVVVEPGGRVGDDFEVINANVEIRGGVIGAEMDAFQGAELRVSGGEFGERFQAHDGSHVNINGGTFADIELLEGSQTRIDNGDFGSIDLGQRANVVFAGGRFQEFSASYGSSLVVEGTEFQIDGIALSEIANPGDSFLVRARNVVITGRLTNGDDFNLPLASRDDSPDFFATNAKLTLHWPDRSTVCDFDNSGICDIADLESMLDAIDSQTPTFDLDSNGTIDTQDIALWLTEAGNREIGRPFLFGDATLDGNVDSLDLNRVGRNWLTVSSWAEGDFNGDRFVNPQDLNYLAQNWLKSGPNGSAVPEPNGCILLTLGVWMLFYGQIQNQRRSFVRV